LYQLNPAVVHSLPVLLVRVGFVLFLGAMSLGATNRTQVTRISFPSEGAMETVDPVLSEGSAWVSSLPVIEAKGQDDLWYVGVGLVNHEIPNRNGRLRGQSGALHSKTLQFDALAETSPERGWQGFASGSFDVAESSHFLVSDGYHLVVSAGGRYAINPQLKLTLGVLGMGSSMNSWNAMPFVGVEWEISQKLKLQTLNGAFLVYDFSGTRNTLLQLGVEYRLQSQAVQNLQGTVFLQADKILLDESGLVGSVGLRHYWKDVFSIRAFAEMSRTRTVELPADAIELPTLPEKNRSLSFGVEGGIRF
jgi:hypothetical protein